MYAFIELKFSLLKSDDLSGGFNVIKGFTPQSFTMLWQVHPVIQDYPQMAITWNIFYQSIMKPELMQFQSDSLQKDHNFGFVGVDVLYIIEIGL